MTAPPPGTGPGTGPGAYPRSRHHAPAALVLALLLAWTLTACSGGDSPDDAAPPAERLAAAQQQLDQTSGLRLRLTSEGLDPQTSGVARAEGVAVHPASFDGTIAVNLSGQEFEVPLVSVDGTVYAQVPLTQGWSEIDPAEYGAPDPAALMRPDSGFSALLTATQEPTAGETVRGGEDNSEVLTEITGTLPGEAVAGIIPSAEGSFDVTYTLTEDDELREVTLTGVFYPGTEAMTYRATFSDYGTERDITAP